MGQEWRGQGGSVEGFGRERTSGVTMGRNCPSQMGGGGRAGEAWKGEQRRQREVLEEERGTSGNSHIRRKAERGTGRAGKGHHMHCPKILGSCRQDPALGKKQSKAREPGGVSSASAT